jgi:hypothetical protein
LFSFWRWLNYGDYSARVLSFPAYDGDDSDFNFPLKTMSTIEQVLTATVTAEQTLDLPPEIRAKLTPGEIYKITVHEDKFELTKVPKFDWEKWRQNLDRDGEEITDEIMEEICELVREVRREIRFERESAS